VCVDGSAGLVGHVVVLNRLCCVCPSILAVHHTGDKVQDANDLVDCCTRGDCTVGQD